MRIFLVFLFFSCFSFGQKQLDSIVEPVKLQLKGYNNRDIDVFLSAFSDNVSVYRYPNELLYTGKKEMKKRYASYFEKTKDLHCTIVKRIVLKNKVIDEELVTANGKQFNAVAIYTVKDNQIVSITFL